MTISTSIQPIWNTFREKTSSKHRRPIPLRRSSTPSSFSNFQVNNEKFTSEFSKPEIEKNNSIASSNSKIINSNPFYSVDAQIKDITELDPPEVAPNSVDVNSSLSKEEITSAASYQESSLFQDMVGVVPNNNSSLNIAESEKVLNSQVKEVRMVPIKKPEYYPQLSEFKYPSGYSNIPGYIAALIKYGLQTVASDVVEPQGKLAELRLTKLRTDIERLNDASIPYRSLAKKISEIYRWEDHFKSSIAFCLYLFLWWYSLLLPVLLLSITGKVIWEKMRILEEEYGFQPFFWDIFYREPTFAVVQQKRRKSQKKKKKDTELRKGLTEFWDEFKKDMGPMLQMQLGDMVDTLERLNNLMTWKKPKRTWQCLFAFVVCAILLYLFPNMISLNIITLFIGIEFFVLLPLQSHFPRYRRLFSLTDLFLWGIPTNAEWAMEVYAKEMEINNNHNLKSISQNNFSASSLIGNPNAFSLADEHEKNFKNNSSEELYIFDPSVNNENHKSLNSHERARRLSLSHSQTEYDTCSSVDGNDTDSETEVNYNESLDPQSYVCSHHGMMGRLSFDENTIFFKPTVLFRSIGAIEIPLDSIYGVKKVKNSKMVFWKRKGLEVILNNGEKHTFGNFSHRDNAFNRIISLTNKKWVNF